MQKSSKWVHLADGLLKHFEGLYQIALACKIERMSTMALGLRFIVIPCFIIPAKMPSISTCSDPLNQTYPSRVSPHVLLSCASCRRLRQPNGPLVPHAPLVALLSRQMLQAWVPLAR